MPVIHVNGAALYYEEHGAGSESIVFAHGLLWSCRMFNAQVALFKERYRCVAFDFRGQGQSEVTRSGYDMETLYEDTVALIEQLGCAPLSLSRPFDGRLYRLASHRQAPRVDTVVDPAGDFR